MIASNSCVLAAINASSPRLSTLSRTTGSVLDMRRLKRQSSKLRLKPSMCSMPLAPAAYKFSTCLMSAGASVTVRLISPEQGKAAARSSTSDEVSCPC